MTTKSQEIAYKTGQYVRRLPANLNESADKKAKTFIEFARTRRQRADFAPSKSISQRRKDLLLRLKILQLQRQNALLKNRGRVCAPIRPRPQIPVGWESGPHAVQVEKEVLKGGSGSAAWDGANAAHNMERVINFFSLDGNFDSQHSRKVSVDTNFFSRMNHINAVYSVSKDTAIFSGLAFNETLIRKGKKL